MPLTREDLIAFLQAYWRVATPKESPVDRRIAQYLQRLANAAVLLTDSDDLPVRKRIAEGAFSPMRRALWINRPALGVWLGKGEPRDANEMLEFYDRGGFRPRAYNFITSKAHETWWAGQLRKAAWPAVPSRSVVVHGVDNAIFWFGIRTSNEIDATIAAHPTTFPAKSLNQTRGRLGELLRRLNASQRAFLLKQLIADDTPGDERRILICGTRALTEKQEAIARAIAAAIIHETDYVLISSGRRFLGHRGTDEAVVRSAEAALDEHDDVKRRIVHYVREGEEADRERVFVGQVETLRETTQATRRFAMVGKAHAVVSIGGTTSIDLIAAAWSNKELVLPLAWTGGASRDFWFEHRKWIIARAELNEQDVRLIEEGGAPEAFGAMCVRVLQRYFGKP